MAYISYTYHTRAPFICRGANSEYTAKSLTSSSTIKFNICGTVKGPIAPTYDSTTNSSQITPIPHSHGVAVQVIPSSTTFVPGPQGTGYCADLDTCDYMFNPSYNGVGATPTSGVCTPGSVNYNDDTNSIPGVTIPDYITRRIATCKAQGPSYCSPTNYWCCAVKETLCTDNAEVLSYYDGSAPNFNLINEGNVNGGISLTYSPALNYVSVFCLCFHSTPRFLTSTTPHIL